MLKTRINVKFPRILGARAEASGKSGAVWDAVFIEAGLSEKPLPDGAREYYDAADLKEAAHLFEHRPVYAHEFLEGVYKHIPDEIKDKIGSDGLVRNIVAYTRDARFGKTPEGNDAVIGQIVFVEQGMDVAGLLRETTEAGLDDFLGLSIDAKGNYFYERKGEILVKRIVLTFVDSVDFVSFPAAGGRAYRMVAERMVAAMNKKQGVKRMKPKLKTLLLTLAAHPVFGGGLKLGMQRFVESLDDEEKAKKEAQVLLKDVIKVAESLPKPETPVEEQEGAPPSLVEQLTAILEAVKQGDGEAATAALEKLIGSIAMPPDGSEVVAVVSESKQTLAKEDKKSEEPEAEKKRLLESKVPQGTLAPEIEARFKALEKENSELKQSVSDMSIDTLKSRITESVGNSALPDIGKNAVITQLVEKARGQGRITAGEIATAIGRKHDEIAAYQALVKAKDLKEMRFTESNPKEHAVTALDAYFLQQQVRPKGGKVIAPFESMYEAARVLASLEDDNPEDLLELMLGKQRLGYRPGHKNTRFWGRQDRFTESIADATFTVMLGDSMTRIAIAEARKPEYNAWRLMVSKFSNVKNFKDQERYAWGYYGTLPIVNKNAPYTALSTPAEESGTFRIYRRGAYELMNIEDIANDDQNNFAKLPSLLGLSWILTIYYAYLNIFLLGETAPASGGTYYIRPSTDSTALFTSAHGNLSTDALSLVGLNTARSAMRSMVARQSVDSKVVMGESNVPKTLWVPNELEHKAEMLTNAQRLAQPATTSAYYAATDFLPDTGLPNTLFGGTGYVVVDEFTNAADFGITADPRKVPMVEHAWWNGKEDPEILIEAPNTGTELDSDGIITKVRGGFGMVVQSLRPFRFHNV